MEVQRKTSGEMSWYVVHTYSGYENKAKLALEERVKSLKKSPSSAKSSFLKKTSLSSSKARRRRLNVDFSRAISCKWF